MDKQTHRLKLAHLTGVWLLDQIKDHLLDWGLSSVFLYNSKRWGLCSYVLQVMQIWILLEMFGRDIPAQAQVSKSSLPNEAVDFDAICVNSGGFCLNQIKFDLWLHMYARKRVFIQHLSIWFCKCDAINALCLQICIPTCQIHSYASRWHPRWRSIRDETYWSSIPFDFRGCPLNRICESSGIIG